MSEERERLIEKAEESITELFSDRSVSQKETSEDLEELQGFIDTMLDALNLKTE